MENVYLVGTEGVERAGRQMASAAESMERAASTISHALEHHERFLEDWLQRAQAVLEEADRGK